MATAAMAWVKRAGGTLAGALKSGGAPLFAAHALAIVAFVGYLVPVFGLGWSASSYRTCCLAVATAGAIKIYRRFGAPPLSGAGDWRVRLEALATWAAPLQMSTDFHYALLVLTLSSRVHRPLALALAPPVILAAYHAAVYLASHPSVSGSGAWKAVGVPAYSAMRARQRDALLFNASCEVGAGAQVLFRLATGAASLWLVLAYGNFLRMRLGSPDASGLHVAVWSKVDVALQPLLTRVPLLQRARDTVVAYAARLLPQSSRPHAQ